LILETVLGLKLDFVEIPKLQTTPFEMNFNQKTSALIDQEIVSMIEKRAIVQVDNFHEGFLSPLFLVEKRGEV